MPVKKHFINRGLQEMLISEYLGTMLDNSGYAGIDMQKTPLGIRITIKTARPGLVIGRRGNRVKDITDEVKSRFNINVPTIDVETVENPDLNAQIVAEKIAYAIEKGQNYRRATYSFMRRIVRSGARGIEVTVSGKVSSQRARTQVFRAGIISKCGTPAIDGVSKGVVHCILKSGVLGIRVKIMPESYQLPDEVTINSEEVSKKKLKKMQTELGDEEDEIIVEEIEKEIGGEEELFDDTSKAAETVLKSDKETLEAEKIIEDLEEKPAAPAKEELKEEADEEKKKASKKISVKKTSRKKSSKKSTKSEDGEDAADAQDE